MGGRACPPPDCSGLFESVSNIIGLDRTEILCKKLHQEDHDMTEQVRVAPQPACPLARPLGQRPAIRG